MTAHAKRQPDGFTLAELLIALAILGIVSAMVIPQLLTNIGKQEFKTKINAAAANLENAWYHLKDRAGHNPYTSLYTNLQPNWNTVGGNPTAQPVGSGCAMYNGYVQFPDGVIVAGLQGYNNAAYALIPAKFDASTTNYVLCIDANGVRPPNNPGQDVFYGDFNASGDFSGGGLGGTTPPNHVRQNFFWGNATQIVYSENGSSTVGALNSNVWSQFDKGDQ